MRKFISIVLAVVMLCSMVAVSTSAVADVADGEVALASNHHSNEPLKAKFYLLNAGLIVPTGTAPCPKVNYSYAGEGTLKADAVETYDDSGVAVNAWIESAPDYALAEGQTITWYVVKYDTSDGWHVDGVITPYYAFLYDPNTTDDTTGTVEDSTHYYLNETATVAANGYVRPGYEFKGWNTAADGTGTAYNPGDVIAINDITCQGNCTITTFYAQWEKTGIIVPPVDPVDPVDPGKTVNTYVVTAKNMAVRFEDGSVYYNGDPLKVELNKEYKFQMCSVNWDNGIYDDVNNGYCGTVVYTMKAVSKNDFFEYRAMAAASTEAGRYTIKGDDVIDNFNHTIVINADAGDFHLETDVNNFFMAYRFHCTEGDYNKQEGIVNVVNVPTESLSVNLPLGSTVTVDFYKRMNYLKSEDVFVENNNGQGIYTSVYLTSVNDYYWSAK